MTTESTEIKTFGWVFLELMGHRQRIGQAKEEEIAGGLMLRIDVPTSGDDYVTEYYGPASIYSMRPITEEVALLHWANDDPRPPIPATFKPEALVNHQDDVDF